MERIKIKIISIGISLITLALSLTNSLSAQQQSDTLRTTQDLSFLIGEWEIDRIYSPNSEGERVMYGTLFCEESLDGKFIKCIYDMKRPGKIRALDVVYFNFNSIYEVYESVWLSSTWPIKGIMQGVLQKRSDAYVFKTSGQFEIENDVMEFVKGVLTVQRDNSIFSSFTRQTHIRTSNFEPDVWHYHMIENAKRMK